MSKFALGPLKFLGKNKVLAMANVFSKYISVISKFTLRLAKKLHNPFIKTIDAHL